ncbi:hypothetical protein Dip510_001155 [Elusimicrobium posterum]|uniref:hypothetical protein n=1 Tax=Elusimicrobium posterum TaxID=3116653 RepID=UPI003C778A7D
MTENKNEIEIIEAEVIEPEVLDQHGRPINEKPRENAAPHNIPGRSLLAVIMVLVGTFLFSLLMALIAIVVFIPLMILKLLGLVKSDVKIYRGGRF